MNKLIDFGSLVSALIFSLLIIISSMFLSDTVQSSEIYKQSRFASFVITQQSDIKNEIIKDPKIFIKFLRAVANAYVNFEMIPSNEASTFIAVLKSLETSINIEDFFYEGKNFIIQGNANNREDYINFLENIRSQKNFTHVSSHDYTAIDDVIRFSIECGTGGL